LRPQRFVEQLVAIRAEPVSRGGGYRGDECFTHRLISRRSLEMSNSTGDQLPRLCRRAPYNAAFMHPLDLERLGIRAGAARRALAPSKVIVFDCGAAEQNARFDPAVGRSENDLSIVSIALAYDLILVTHDAAEFSRVRKLRVENWAASRVPHAVSTVPAREPVGGQVLR
jgi:hypothetical protein